MAIEPIRQDIPRNDSRTFPRPAHGSDLFVGAGANDSEIDGMELSDAARLMGISIDDLWRQVRNGRLIARTERGRVLVYTDASSRTQVEGLPPLPERDILLEPTLNQRAVDTISILTPSPDMDMSLVTSRDNADRQEIALLIDHLSLAKEENREILRLTTESMNRLTEMTDKMLEMKDSIISSKEEQMQMLRQRLSEQAQELREALQAKEDLETLAQALQTL